jgi:predicted nucleic acid-binding protein
MLALELEGSVAVLDDAAARAAAEQLSVPIIGTLGILKSAKRAGLLPRVLPYLDRLETLGFRLAKGTRAAVLSDAGEI